MLAFFFVFSPHSARALDMIDCPHVSIEGRIFGGQYLTEPDVPYLDNLDATLISHRSSLEEHLRLGGKGHLSACSEGCQRERQVSGSGSWIRPEMSEMKCLHYHI